MTHEALEMSKKSAARVMELEKEVAALTYDVLTATAERDQKDRELAALTKERADFYMQYRMQCDTETKVLHEQLAAAQATNARMREAHYELAKAVRELLPMFCKDPEKFKALVESEAAIESVKLEA